MNIKTEYSNLIKIVSEKKETKRTVWGLVLFALFVLIYAVEFCAPVIYALVRNSEALQEVFAGAGIITVILVGAGVLLLFKLALERKTKKVWIFAGAGILLAALFAILLRKSFVSGGTIYLNTILSHWNAKTGSVVYFYDYSGEGATFALCLFMGVIALALTSLVELLFYYERKVELLVLNVLLFLGVWLAIPTAPIWSAVLTGLLMIHWNVYFGADKSAFSKNRLYYVVPIAVVVVIFLLVYGCAAVLPGTVMNHWQAGLISFIDDLSFGKSDLTEGDLKKAREKSTSTDQRLKIDIDLESAEGISEEAKKELLKKHRTYLKGFVGSRYTGSGWEDLSEEAYQDTATAKNLSMFQWLSSREAGTDDPEFLPISSAPTMLSLDNQYNLPGEALPALETFTYQIENAGASKKYLYYPTSFTEAGYEGADGKQPLDVDQMNRDLNIKNNLFNHVDSYYAKTTELPADSYVELRDYGKLSNEEFRAIHEALIRREQNYNSFVDQCYNYRPARESERIYYEKPALTEELIEYLEEQEDLDRTNVGGAYEITWQVREFLERHLKYSEKPTTTYGTSQAVSDDYVVNLLENDKEGYSVQYATAATLLFRYMGIPARYVEGYMVKGDTNSVVAEDAHAWVEIYRYGFGWVNVEVTPGEYEIPEERQLLQRPPRNPENGEEINSDEDDMNTEDSENDGSSSGRNLFWIWVLALIAAVLLAIFLRHLIAIKLRKKKIHGEDYRENIRVMGKYILKNTALAQVNLRKDFPRNAAKRMNEFLGSHGNVRFEETADAIAHALYSKEGATTEDAGKVEQCLLATEKALYDPAGFWKKLKLKYIDLVC